jgi:hypothetical protein
MLSVTWGDFLSMLLPGAVALFALGAWIPALDDQLKGIHSIGAGEGFALLLGAALLGGVLEALTRVTWEKYWLRKWCPSASILHKLNNTNLELYEHGVQRSYKWVTFYANLAWATIALLVSRWHRGSTVCSLSTSVLIIIVALLMWASYVQWTYYVNYQNKVFGGHDDASK